MSEYTAEINTFLRSFQPSALGAEDRALVEDYFKQMQALEQPPAAAPVAVRLC
jgi:hypothetical protein